MPSNIEIKAYARNFKQQRITAADISTGPGQVIKQEDIFFKVEEGRLKLRIFGKDAGELIFYRRENSRSARKSEYYISKTYDPGTLKDVLSKSNGILGTVRKTRVLYTHGQTRIHLDSVEHLGDFIELEYVMGPDDSEETGKETVRSLMNQLGISDKDLIDVAYFDLLHGSR